jgi:ATP-binding cassette subfamily B (MDR/TAP) protein 1
MASNEPQTHQTIDSTDEKIEGSSSHSIPDTTASEKARDGEKTPAEPALQEMQPGPEAAVLALKKLDSKVPAKAGKEPPQDPFAHLPEHEADILRKQVETPDVKVGYTTLFRYADGKDWSVLVLSIACAIIAGAGMPLMTVCMVN